MKNWMTQWGSMVVHSEVDAADHHGYEREIETVYGTSVPTEENTND